MAEKQCRSTKKPLLDSSEGEQAGKNLRRLDEVPYKD